MKFLPRDWQTPITQFITQHRRCSIWADMGSGKTAATLTALELIDMADAVAYPALVVAPKRPARGVWPQETLKWDHLKHLRVSAITGNVKQRRRALYTKADIHTINYENIPWLVEICAEKWPFKTVICDESTRLKGFRMRAGTKRSAALARIARQTYRWINLTGTPAPNGLKDLWGQQWFLDFGHRLGRTWTDFKRRWFDVDAYKFEVTPKQYAQEQIHKALEDVTLTIQLKDYVDLKKPVVSQVYVDMPDKLMRKYREFERKMFMELAEEKELNAVNAAAKSMKCLQLAAGAVYYEEDKWEVVHDLKLDALESVIEETAGANLLVTYWWRHDRERLLKRFKHARLLSDAKDEDDWNAGKIPLLLAHPQSAGHGLNLQDGGHHLVFFSDFWNHEYKRQIIERIGPARQLQAGYDRPVYVYEILTRGTLDESVAECHVTKASVQQVLMDAMKKRRAE